MEQPLAPPAEHVITGLKFLVDLPLWSLVGQQDEKEQFRSKMAARFARVEVLALVAGRKSEKKIKTEKDDFF